MTESVITNTGDLLESWDPVRPQQAYLDIATSPFTRPDGIRVLGRREDIVALNRHPAVHSSDGVHFDMSSEALIPLHIDGPAHRMYRRLLDPLFAPKVVEKLQPAVRQLTDKLIDTFIDQGSTDFFESFCQPLPSTIFLELLGLPQSDVPVFLRFKDSVIRPEGETDEERQEFIEREGARMREYLQRVFDEREASGDPGDDLIGGFLTAEVEGRKLTHGEVMNIVYLLVIAGLDTVSASLSCIIGWLAHHPEERAALVADPSLLPTAVEELMRFESPVMAGHRYVTEDIEVNGQRFAAGEAVEVSWAAANVDPDAFPDPLTVDIRRRRNAHIDFATGPHRCLGSNLARMEIVTALEQLHRRIPDYWITEGQEPMYMNVGVRLAAYLPLSFTKAELA